MADSKDLIPVYYDRYEMWEHDPVARAELGKIPADTARALVHSLRRMSGTTANTCLYQVHLDYRKPENVLFHATTPYNDTKIHELAISGIWLNGEKKCTGRTAKYDHNDEYACISKMRCGKCVCPAGRVIAAALWPEMYAQNKQNTK